MKTNDEYKALLRSLSSKLAKIHRMLIENEIEDLEKAQGVRFNPNARLQLLLNAPELAWLRNMSQLMAFVDEIFFQKEEVTEEQMEAARKGVDELLIKQTNAEFSEMYRKRMGIVPDLIIEHGHLKTILKDIVKNQPT